MLLLPPPYLIIGQEVIILQRVTLSFFQLLFGYFCGNMLVVNTLLRELQILLTLVHSKVHYRTVVKVVWVFKRSH